MVFKGKSFFLTAALALFPALAHAEFQAGAVVVDVTPLQFPVIVNGSFASHTADKALSPINARAIAMSNGDEKVVMIVVDSCMINRELLDDVKQLAATATGMKPDHILISATHSHSAPSSMGCLGTDADPNYVPYLRVKLVETVEKALANLEPAKVGYHSIEADDYAALRRWIRRPDRIELDPFGNPTVRANMHAGRNWDDVVGESGPKDPDLSLISIKANDGRPIAVLANFSMHYFGDAPLSADYFGRFSDGLKEKIAPESGDHPPFVGIMSHGCSGDIWRFDYTQPEHPKNTPTIEAYTAGLLDLAMQAYDKIEYQENPELLMAETRIPMSYRLPTQERLEWAKKLVAEFNGKLPTSAPDVYAREALILDEWKNTEVVVQAIRVGEIGIATTPTETYAITALKIKLQSPFKNTMVIELANGGDGYIPPVEQHLLGGYNTFPARSAGLEVQAESKITAAAIHLLSKVADRARREYTQSSGPAVEAVLRLKPDAYYRLDEFSGPRAKDSSGNDRDGIYEAHVAYFLEGPLSRFYNLNGERNRSVHFTGDRLRPSLPTLNRDYTVSTWIWNGMPTEGRDVTGWIFSRGQDHVLGEGGDHLGLGGTSGHQGRLIYSQGNSGELIGGTTEIARWTWNHVALVREGNMIRVYLNGNPTPEIEAEASAEGLTSLDELFFGGRCDNQFSWEGRQDEVAIFNRALSASEISKLLPPRAKTE